MKWLNAWVAQSRFLKKKKRPKRKRKISEKMLQQERPVIAVIDQTESYPYTPTVQLTGLAINNAGADLVTVVIRAETDITINVPAGKSYDADFKAIRTINVTAGTTYQIELRGL